MRLVVLAAALTLCACAPALNSPMSSAGSAKQANEMALQIAELQGKANAARDLAEKKCEPLLRREVGWEEERSIGADLAVAFTAKTGHLYLDGVTEKDPQKLLNQLSSREPLSLPSGGRNAVTTHVATVGRNLSRYSARPDLPWVFGVVESESPRAFSTPGGFVFVTTALLKKMTNEAQLAGVLGHEIAHVVQKDLLRNYVDAKHKQCVAATFAAAMLEAGAANNPSAAEAARYARSFASDEDSATQDPGFRKFILDTALMLAQLGGDKEREFETDKVALQLVSFAGYDPVEYEQFLTTWKQENHPPSTDRAAKLENLRKNDLKDFAVGTNKAELGKDFAPLSAP